MEYETKPSPKHLGRKIKKMRDLLGVRQEALAEKLDTSQQAISKIEQTEDVDEVVLEKVAKALGVNSEAIKNLDEDATVYNIVANHGAVDHISGLQNYMGTQIFNPMEKWEQSIKENKKLYEALLKEKDEKIAMLKKLLEDRK